MTTPNKNTRKAGTAKKTPARRADPYVDKQGQQIDSGGTADVPIVMKAVVTPTFSGRTPKPEKYPFSKLDYSKDVNGERVGPSFFIPDNDDPQKVLAANRKRWNGRDGKELRKFWARSDEVEIDGKTVAGVSVWRASKEEEAKAKAELEAALAAKKKAA